MFLEELRESIKEEDSILPIPNEHKDELNRRLETINESSLLTLEELKKRVDKEK